MDMEDSQPHDPEKRRQEHEDAESAQADSARLSEISQLRRMSDASSSSAAERLYWRNHQQLATPNPELRENNPFEDALPKLEAKESSGDGEKAEGDAEGGGMGVNKHEQERSKSGKNLSFRERIRHFTWTWFTMTMATGGIANVLYTMPFRFHGLYALGCIFFILNMVLFLFNICMISLRFYFYPRTFKASFLHPTESLFIPASVISFGTILINITQYGVGSKTGYWLEETMCILFWMDCGLAIVFSLTIYLIMWSTQTFTISQMTPVWIFPAYPLLIIGPHAANLSAKTHGNRALDIIVSGFVIQGIGFMVSLMIYSAFLYRLMTQKLPRESLRPGMFISVGPSGFTISAIIGMGQHLPSVVPPNFMGEGMGEFAGKVSMICANWVGLWLWGLALWFFFVSVGAHWSCATRGKLDFAMTWYSFIFPNTALTTATFGVAKALGGNKPIQYVGCAMTVGLIITWFFVFIMMIRAVLLKQILWPHKQEDRTEGGFKQANIEEQRRRAWQDVGDREDGLGRVWTLRKVSSRRGGTADADGSVAAQEQRPGRVIRGWSVVSRRR